MAASDDDQSSINLSLRLRCGSSDSRDSFYMDFDKGIDSDIDMEPCTRAEDQATGTSANDCTLSSCEDETDDAEHRENDPYDQDEEGGISEEKTNWVGIQRPTEGHQAVHAPSPISQSHMLASPEPTSLVSSHGNSLPKLPNGSIDHKSPARNIHSCDAIARPRPNNGHYHSISRNRLEMTPPPLIDMSPTPTPPSADHCIMKYSGKDDDDDDVFAQKPSRYNNMKPKYIDTLVVVLSAMYAKLLVVMGVGFPLAEVISSHITTSFFVVFYLYLYFGSILFLIYAYTFLLRSNSPPSSKSMFKSSKDTIQQANKVGATINNDLIWKKKRVEEAGVHCGSFYLRMGAVAFGIGSMIYSGLEFGQFFELDPNSACYSILVAITPCTQMAFTFIQLYFIFLNSKMCIYKYKNLARFGLMHMVATNLCIWLNVLIQESKHEILAFADHSINRNENFPTTFSSSESLVLPQYNPFMEMDVINSSFEDTADILNQIDNSSHHRVTRGIPNHEIINTQCRRINIMGQLVQDASPFLFPCTIEYSLISAAILYIMWKNIGRQVPSPHNSVSSELSIVTTSRRHYYSVDCAHANKGLFTGILILVLAIISLILFFVLINKPEFKDLAVLEAHVCELVLYSLCTVATFIALYQVREMRYNPHKYIELDNILLVVAQTGVYLFAIFCIIGGQFAMDGSSVLVLVTAVGNLVQATVQTIFILDATRRQAISTDQMRRKPGREMITFLLVCNFAMWAINTLESRRADSNPVQLNFYGFWAWTIISHVSTPLAIFFRFHSTVCLCEIWKKIYKPKPDRL